MHSGSSLTPNNPAFSISVGIASLVLEGRPLCEDEYATTTIDAKPSTVGKYARTFENASSSAFASTSQNYGSCSSVVDRTLDDTLNRYHYDNEPKEQNQQLLTLQQHQQQQSNHQPASVKCDEAVQHIQRLRHKLLLIRSSPSTSRDEQSIAITGTQQPPANGYESDDELDLIFKPQLLREGNVLNSLHSLATSTCLRTTPRSFNRTHGLLKTVEAWTVSGYVADQERQKQQESTGMARGEVTSVVSVEINSTSSSSSTSQKKDEKKPSKQFGPHCEQFMKKIGLIKVAGVEQTSKSTINIPGKTTKEIPDIEVHYCSETNENVSLYKIVLNIKCYNCLILSVSVGNYIIDN